MHVLYQGLFGSRSLKGASIVFFPLKLWDLSPVIDSCNGYFAGLCDHFPRIYLCSQPNRFLWNKVNFKTDFISIDITRSPSKSVLCVHHSPVPFQTLHQHASPNSTHHGQSPPPSNPLRVAPGRSPAAKRLQPAGLSKQELPANPHIETQSMENAVRDNYDRKGNVNIYNC